MKTTTLCARMVMRSSSYRIMSKPSNDFDIVTSATNDEIKALLPNVDLHAI